MSKYKHKTEVKSLMHYVLGSLSCTLLLTSSDQLKINKGAEIRVNHFIFYRQHLVLSHHKTSNRPINKYIWVCTRIEHTTGNTILQRITYGSDIVFCLLNRNNEFLLCIERLSLLMAIQN